MLLEVGDLGFELDQLLGFSTELLGLVDFSGDYSALLLQNGIALAGLVQHALAGVFLDRLGGARILVDRVVADGLERCFLFLLGDDVAGSPGCVYALLLILERLVHLLLLGEVLLYALLEAFVCKLPFALNTSILSCRASRFLLCLSFLVVSVDLRLERCYLLPSIKLLKPCIKVRFQVVDLLLDGRYVWPFICLATYIKDRIPSSLGRAR
ncbi:hypothetical protein D3C79_658850 [compost metagenome]